MQIGATLPQVGAEASPEALARAAQRAEDLGYDGLWVAERLLYPVEPRSPYPFTPDGVLPAFTKRAFTPIETLTYVAAHTRRIALGTSILSMPLHNPIMLARQLATLDALSGGRLRVGLGQGWSIDELEAGGGYTGQRGALANEFIAVLKTIWTTDPAEFAGNYFTLPRSILQPKPAQRPYPPIYLGGSASGALDRAGRMADGWLPVGVPLAKVGRMMDQIRESARAAGRDSDALRLVVISFAAILQHSLGEERPDFVGTLDEIKRDLERARELGVAEIVLTVGYATGDLSLDNYFRTLEQLRNVVASGAS
jgi:probable F420-dependent oxidoreductase